MRIIKINLFHARIMKIIEFVEFPSRITKNLKIYLFQPRLTKIMKFIKFHANITKQQKKIIIPTQNHENH